MPSLRKRKVARYNATVPSLSTAITLTNPVSGDIGLTLGVATEPVKFRLKLIESTGANPQVYKVWTSSFSTSVTAQFTVADPYTWEVFYELMDADNVRTGWISAGSKAIT